MAIDLSLDKLLIITGNDKGINFSKSIKLTQDRNGILFKTLINMTNENFLDLKKFKIIYSTIGPGNSNGIRIAISTIKAFALANKNINIAGISSLDALSRSIPNLKMNVCVAIKSSPGYLYVQWFDKFYKPISKIEILNIEEKINLPIHNEKFLLIGNGSEILAKKLEVKFSIYRCNSITAEGIYSSIRNMLLNNINLKASPIYFKNTTIVEPSLWKKFPIVK